LPGSGHLMREFEKHVLDDQAHEIFLLWWYRTVPHHAYVKGWKISASHYLNQAKHGQPSFADARACTLVPFSVSISRSEP
jgi:hypothetical protein